MSAVKQSLRSSLIRTGDWIAIRHLRLLRRVWADRAISLNYWRMMRRILGALDPAGDSLSPPPLALTSSGSELEIPELRDLLRDDQLGAWAMDHHTLNFLWRVAQRERPRIVLECGAGASTILFAQYAAVAGFTPGSFVCCSLEQDADYLNALERRLRDAGLDGFVRLLHAPVNDQGEYQADPAIIQSELGGREVDWVIIDGPSGPPGCRVATLPRLAPLCKPGAQWFLDDALRDGELGALSHWSTIDGIRVEGIMPVGKGLATGKLQGNVAPAWA